MSETKSQIASRTAKGGIDAEYKIANKFNNWKTDKDAQKWLEVMSYDLNLIEKIEACTIGGKSEKTDVQVHIKVQIKSKKTNKKGELDSIENIQVKKVSNSTGSNQMERKHVEKYVKPWHIPANVAETLKYFTGDLKPYISNPIDKNRMYMEEMTQKQRDDLKNFLTENMVMIISDIVRGRGRFAVEWMLVLQDYYDKEGQHHYNDLLLSINETINYYVGDHTVEFPPARKDGSRAGIRIGRVTVQRKGGDDPCCLQFKSDPSKLLNLKSLFE